MVQSQANAKIFVKSKDLGFFTQTNITVQRFEIVDGDRELVFCNHANATEEVVEHETFTPSGKEIVWAYKITTCDKSNCDAWKREGSSIWEDTPYRGAFV